MVVAAIGLDTMRDGHHTTEHRTEMRQQSGEQWTVKSVVASLALLPALVALQAAPALVAGTLLGVGLVALGKKVADKHRRSRTTAQESPSKATASSGA